MHWTQYGLFLITIVGIYEVQKTFQIFGIKKNGKKKNINRNEKFKIKKTGSFIDDFFLTYTSVRYYLKIIK